MTGVVTEYLPLLYYQTDRAQLNFSVNQIKFGQKIIRYVGHTLYNKAANAPRQKKRLKIFKGV